MNPVRRTQVSLQRCADYERQAVRGAVRRLLEPLGGMGAFVRPGQIVLLKPNLIVPRPSAAAVTTHPEVVCAVALEVLEAGGRPVVGDSPAFSSAQAVARRCGLLAAMRELGVEVVDLGRRGRLRSLGDGSPFARTRLGAAALEADVLINLPKIKTHCQMGMSLGTKNLFGAVAGKRKALFHFRVGHDALRFGRLLVAVARLLMPALTIADGIVALERDGPTGGDPRPLGLLAASADCVAADRVVLEVLGVDPATVPYLTAAREMGWGEQDLGRIEIVGETIEAMRVEAYRQVAAPVSINFTLPRVVRSVARQAVYLLRARIEKSSD